MRIFFKGPQRPTKYPCCSTDIPPPSTSKNQRAVKTRLWPSGLPRDHCRKEHLQSSLLDCDSVFFTRFLSQQLESMRATFQAPCGGQRATDFDEK